MRQVEYGDSSMSSFYLGIRRRWGNLPPVVGRGVGVIESVGDPFGLRSL